MKYISNKTVKGVSLLLVLCISLSACGSGSQSDELDPEDETLDPVEPPPTSLPTNTLIIDMHLVDVPEL